MDVRLKYGHGSVVLVLDRPAEILTAGRAAVSPDEDGLIREALAQPVAGPPLRVRVRAGQTVAVVTADVTRPCPTARLLPPILAELQAAGIPDRDVTVVFGMGTHRPHTAEEQRALLGESYGRVACLDSDPGRLKSVGTTSRGTPVEVFGPVLDADARVLLGVIEYHYFAGYSGGLKALVPGVCGKATIQANHRRMTEAGAVAGRLDGNPVREDLEEAAGLIGADFLLNAVLDGPRIVRAVAGDPTPAHRAGCAALDAFGRATLREPADLVIVSAGGYPKDLDLYQAQKALDNARQVVRPGGIVVLLAECADGLGNATFEAWMQDPGGPAAILARIRRDFVLGGHKAAAVALAMQRAEIFLVSAMPAERVAGLGLRPFAQAEAALHAALARLGPGARVAVMPEGGSVLPAVLAA